MTFGKFDVGSLDGNAGLEKHVVGAPEPPKMFADPEPVAVVVETVAVPVADPVPEGATE